MCNSQNSTGKYLSLYSISLSSRVPLKGSLTRHLNILCRRRPQTVRRARRGQGRPRKITDTPEDQKYKSSWEPKWPPQKRPEHARRGRNSRETTAGASKRNGIRAKSQRERRNATEFARNHSGSVETKAPPHRVRRCGPQLKRLPQKRPEHASRGWNSRETTAGASKRNGIRAKL